MEWQDGDDTALYDDGFEAGRKSLHDVLYGLYSDFEYALLEDENPSDDAVSALSDWVSVLRREGVLDDEAWNIARSSVRRLGGSVEEV